MEQKVRDILKAAFPGIKVDTDVQSDGRISGCVVWAGFDEVDDVGRQDQIRTVLREKLGDEARQVGVLLAYTPHEMKAMRAA